jgi:twitching motility protein PilT
MTEIVLGMGRQKSVRSVIALAEAQIRRTLGVPRKITVRATGIEIVAERQEFEGEFTSYVLRLKLSGNVLQSIMNVVGEFGDSCSLSEESGSHVLLCPPGGSGNPSRALEAVDKLSTCLALPEVWRISGDNFRVDYISTELLFKAMVEYKASDVHLAPGQTPVFRVDSDIHTSDLLGPLSATQILALIREVASEQDWADFNEKKQASFNFHQVGLAYSRVSAFVKSGAPHVTFRFLPEVIPSFEELNIPRDIMINLANLHHGLVLITGMTGSGKTTTVAAMVDWLNSTKPLHILTIENPIEYVYANKMSVISQRGLGPDVPTFYEAVTGALRHDPDVIVIGEMRDSDTIRAAINAAATGHLVISTLHSNTASEIMNRIVGFFDPVERDLVKMQLRDSIRCVICQRLVPKIGGGRMPALEIMYNDIKPINDAILDGNTDAIRVGMQQSISRSFLFESYLHKLYKARKIDLAHAREYSTEVSIFDQLNMGTYTVPRLDTLKAAREVAHAKKA